MGKKRHSDDSSESNTPSKKEKALEFNGTEFKAMLKEPGKAMKGECLLIKGICNLACFGLFD